MGLAEDMKWIRGHASDLQNKYPDMYVAIYKGKVIAANKDLNKVYEKVRKYGEQVIIKYVFSGDFFVL